MTRFGLVVSLCLVLISLPIFLTNAGSLKIYQGLERNASKTAAGVASCFITDPAGNIVVDVSISSIFGNDHQMYYLWYLPSTTSFNQKFVLKFDSEGVGVSKMVEKFNYNLNNGDGVALSFAITVENTSLGPAKFKVKTDTESCTYLFNVVP